jgi:succinate dehydrogenase flavin-adding protein (antitoxin of CptAB toxin-antitoxin module)
LQYHIEIDKNTEDYDFLILLKKVFSLLSKYFTPQELANKLEKENIDIDDNLFFLNFVKETITQNKTNDDFNQYIKLIEKMDNDIWSIINNSNNENNIKPSKLEEREIAKNDDTDNKDNLNHKKEKVREVIYLNNSIETPNINIPSEALKTLEKATDNNFAIAILKHQINENKNTKTDDNFYKEIDDYLSMIWCGNKITTRILTEKEYEEAYQTLFQSLKDGDFVKGNEELFDE